MNGLYGASEMTTPTCQICGRKGDIEAKGWHSLGPFQQLEGRYVWVCPECGLVLSAFFDSPKIIQEVAEELVAMHRADITELMDR